jgi:digeranylgeranylglycerophospholipid reductase
LGSDALVVGAGPAGLLTAKEISSRAFSVKILEEHAKVGVPSHCAGLISIEGLKKIGVGASDVFVQNEIVGGRIYSPDGQCIEIRDKRPRAYVINRAAFDGHIAESAVDAGVELVLGRRAEKITLSKDGVNSASGADWVERARLVVDAEGPSRRLIKQAHLVKVEHKPLLGINTEIQCEIESDMVEIWFGDSTAPGFFA